MTLILQVTKYTADKFDNSSYLYVEGSEAGPLLSKSLSTENFIIKCNKNNILKFQLYNKKSPKEQGQPLAQNQFSATRYVRENFYKPEFHNREQLIQQFPLFKYGKEIGTITLSIRYIKGQLFMGEKYGDFETIPQRQPVKIYTGVCETRNLFNCFDYGTEGKRWQLIETTYRDQSWGNP